MCSMKQSCGLLSHRSVLYNFFNFWGGGFGGSEEEGSNPVAITLLLLFLPFFSPKYFHSTHTITLLSPYILFPLLLSLAEETGLVLGIQLTIFYVYMLECVCMCVSVILWSLSLLASSRAVSLKAAHQCIHLDSRHLFLLLQLVLGTLGQ